MGCAASTPADEKKEGFDGPVPAAADAERKTAKFADEKNASVDSVAAAAGHKDESALHREYKESDAKISEALEGKLKEFFTKMDIDGDGIDDLVTVSETANNARAEWFAGNLGPDRFDSTPNVIGVGGGSLVVVVAALVRIVARCVRLDGAAEHIVNSFKK